MPKRKSTTNPDKTRTRNQKSGSQKSGSDSIFYDWEHVRETEIFYRLGEDELNVADELRRLLQLMRSETSVATLLFLEEME